MEIHLDPLGGWSGDMFVAAMLDAFPEHWPAVRLAVGCLGLGPAAECRLVEHRDAALTGRRFLVAAEAPEARPPADLGSDGFRGDNHHHHSHHDHGHHHTHDHGHPMGSHHPHGGHRAWAAIREHIEASQLDRRVKDRAIGIFTLLAAAEAEVHGVSEDEVMFHEVGAVDSIVDIVAAAEIIARVDAGVWTAAPLPLGSGRVRTQHGILPVPAPATALLLRGLAILDDGIAGERVTPTGAAVARFLLKDLMPGPPRPRRLLRTGTGFGQRVLPGISNCLRILVFDDRSGSTAPEASGAFGHREIDVVAFEVDDQSAEDLAAGLDHIRQVPGVHDVVQSVVFGKKGRLATQAQVLVAPEALDAAIAACFEETTTIGLRYHRVRGAALSRGFDEVEIEGRALRVKAVHRPETPATAKTEASDVADVRGHAARARLRREAEAAALSRLGTGEARVGKGIGDD